MVNKGKVAKQTKAEVAKRAPRGAEELDSDDIIQPRVVLNQALSPAVQDNEAKAGTFMNNISGEVYGEKVSIQPIKIFKTRIKWIPRSDGGGMECRSFDGKLGTEYGDCKVCPHRQWNGDNPPTCDEIFNFLCLIRKENGDKDIAVVSFAKTSWKSGKQLASKIKMEAMMNNRDAFAKKYDLVSRKKTNDKGSFFVMDTNSGVLVDDDEYVEGEKAYEAWANIAVRVDYEDEEHLTEEDIDDDIPF